MVFVEILKPSADAVTHGMGVGYGCGYDSEIVVVEGICEGFAHATALRDGDIHEAEEDAALRGKVPSLDRHIGQPVVGQPLCGMSCRAEGEAFFDSLQNHAADIGAEDAGACPSLPGDDLPVVGVHDEGHPGEIPVPAGELQTDRVAPQNRSLDCDRDVIGLRAPAPLALGAQEPVELRQVVDALTVSRSPGVRCQCTVQVGRDVAVAIDRSRTDQAPPSRKMGRGSGHAIAMTDPPPVLQPLLEIGAGHVQSLSYGFHREPRVSGERVSKVSPFVRDFDRASLGKSTLRVLRPSWHSSLRTRSSR